MDDLLRENVHYDLCRRLGQLGAVQVVRVCGGLEAYTDRLHATGQRLGDIKPQVLSPQGGWTSVFRTHP